MSQVLSVENIHAEKKSFYLILTVSIISFLTLTYQTYLFYFEGYCGCSGGPIFELYSSFWGIPISLIGMIGVGISIVLSTFFLFVKDDYLFFDKMFLIFRLWFIMQVFALLFVINLMYLAYILAQSWCELCLVTQIATIVIFIVLLRLLNKFKFYFYYNEFDTDTTT